KPDGSPDLDRASALRSIMREDADEVSRTNVQPYAQTVHQQQANANYYQLVTTPGLGGGKPDKAVFDALWSRIDPAQSAKRTVAAAIHAMAVGMSGHKAQPVVAPPAAPPIVSEPSNAPPRRPTVTELDRAVAAHKNVSAESFAKLAGNFVKGRPTV